MDSLIEQDAPETASETHVTHEITDGATGVEIEESSDEEKIEQPFNPTLIRVNSRLITLDLLLSRLRDNAIDLAPDFQRKAGIWNKVAASRLIESILIRIPLPAFYLDGTDDDRWIVVDGLQRLTVLNRFANTKELKLTGLEFLKDFEDKGYDDLPRNYQRRIQETQVTIFLIEAGTPPEVKFNIFKRINTGGLPLSPQEIRHALNQGPVTKLLARLANTPEFKKATNYGIKDDRMTDRECVLRFLSFVLVPYNNYKAQELDSFLNERMAEINNMSDIERENLEHRFLRSMNAASDIFGRYAFRKQYESNGNAKPINKALFEVWSVTLDSLHDDQLKMCKSRKSQISRKFIQLMNNSDFDRAVSQGTGDIGKIKLRFDRVAKLVQEVIE